MIILFPDHSLFGTGNAKSRENVGKCLDLRSNRGNLFKRNPTYTVSFCVGAGSYTTLQSPASLNFIMCKTITMDMFWTLYKKAGMPDSILETILLTLFYNYIYA